VKLRYVGNAPFFSALSEQEQKRVSERMHLERHRSGESLFRRGDDSSALYLIKSGWVQLQANGGPALASQGPGALVGETDLFLDRPRSLGATTASEVEVWILGKADLVDLIAENPLIGFKLRQAFGSGLAIYERYLVEHRLRALPYLSGLQEDDLLAIAQQLVPVEKEKDEFVLEGGQAPEALFIVESGQVHLHSSEEDGDFSELGEGESFGELAMLTGKPHTRSVQAATDLFLWALPVAEFNTLAEEHPDIRLALSETIREPLLARDQKRAVERLAIMPLFTGLPKDVLQAIGERLLLRHVPAGALVFAEGTPGDALYIIDNGQVEIVSDSRPGAFALARLGADEFFGEMALLSGRPRSSAARTVNHTNLWVLYRSDFDDLVNRYPTISLAMSKVLSQRLEEMDRRFTESHLRGLKLLAGLSSSQLEDVGSRLRPSRFEQDETVIKQGEPGDEMYFIESGRARVVREISATRALVLAELGAGDLFGEMALLTGAPRSATVTALSELNLWVLDQVDFDELVTVYPNLALAVSRLLSERLRETDERFLHESSATYVMPARPVPAVQPQPEPKAVPVSEPAPAPKAKPRRRIAPWKAARAVRTDLKKGFDGTVTWFGSLSRGARVRLILFTVLLAWLLCIAAPVMVISTLAADDVTNLQGAIAFVQTATPVPTDAPLPTDTSVPQAAMVPAPTEPVAELAVQIEPSPEAVPEEPTSVPVPESPTPVPPTPTPYIIVITNTPPPATDTPVPTDTPLPPTPTPTRAPQRVISAAEIAPTATTVVIPELPRELDPRLPSLNVVIQPAGVRPGQSYWRLVEARWQNEEEARGDHTIYVDVLDEGGSRILNAPIEIRWPGASITIFTEDKPADEYPSNFPMYNTLGSYAVSLPGLPSDAIVGLGLGTPEQPAFTIHTNFFLTFRRTTR
jgi:CRP-like cAMP-binding protein/outer membrane biosynthesis protein TonB